MNPRKILYLALFPVMLGAQEARDIVPLKNWSNPLYWRASQAEKEARGTPAPQLYFSATQVSPDALSFVAITPCRLLDTRGTTTGFSSQSPFNAPLAAAGTLTIPVQGDSLNAPCGTIPTNAQAYSVNITLIPVASGQVNFLTVWPAGAAQPVIATMNDKMGLILANAAIVSAGTTYGGISFYNSGPSATNVVIDMNGFFAAPTDLLGNTAIGTGALDTCCPIFNTATGFGALHNDTGEGNAALGYEALQANTHGSGNTAVGEYAAQNNISGYFNTAIGQNALRYNLTGFANIAIGLGAGSSAPVGNSNSVYIGSQGTDNDVSGTIQIGTQGTQTGGTFIAGISGVTSSSGVEVFINTNGQLGTVMSSGRFKEEISDMGDASDKLLQLRPVAFYYKPEYDDGSHLAQYGLIAEEVAEVYPEMVAYGKDGKPWTVRYQLLAPMLLNELQKQAAQNKRQDEQIRHQAEENQSLERRLAALEALLPVDTVQRSGDATNR